MALNVKTIRFDITEAMLGTSQNITSPGFGDVKFALVTFNSADVDGVPSNEFGWMGTGFLKNNAGVPEQSCSSYVTDNNQATTRTSGYQTTQYLARTTNARNTVWPLSVACTGFVTDGITINISDVNQTASFVITFFGGDGVKNVSLGNTSLSSVSSTTITTGHPSSLVMWHSAGHDGGNNVRELQAAHNFGVYPPDSSKARSVSVAFRGAYSSSYPVAQSYTNESNFLEGYLGDRPFQLNNFTATGFDYQITSANTANIQLYYLAIEFDESVEFSCEPETITSATTDLGKSLGFLPAFVMSVGATGLQQYDAAGSNVLGMGGINVWHADGVNTYEIGLSDLRAADPTNVNVYRDSSPSTMQADGTVALNGGFLTFNDDGYDVTSLVNNQTYDSRGFYLAISTMPEPGDIFLGGTRFSAIKAGLDEVSKVFLGAIQIWPKPATPPEPVGQSIYTTPGTYQWECPPGVTAVDVVCVGAGCGNNSANTGGHGGGGGGLGYKNAVTVVPGQLYTVVVGGRVASDGIAELIGEDSYFIDAATVRGGGGGFPNGVSSGGIGGDFTGDGGGNGGNGGAFGSINISGTIYYGGGGGGGAGGYSGDGGLGGSVNATPSIRFGADGAGGGAGGASCGFVTGGFANGFSGGGVGLYGEGANGAGGGNQSNGGGGSGGTSADGGGQFGGSSGGWRNTPTTGGQGLGAVRIVWGPNSPSFP